MGTSGGLSVGEGGGRGGRRDRSNEESYQDCPRESRCPGIVYDESAGFSRRDQVRMKPNFNGEASHKG